MSLKLVFAALLASAQVSPTLAADQPYPTGESRQGMRLIKTSPSDPGTWMSRDDVYRLIQPGKKFGDSFVDITNIKDTQVLDSLARSANDNSRVATAGQFPDKLSHIDEANELIEARNMTEPQQWLEKLAS